MVDDLLEVIEESRLLSRIQGDMISNFLAIIPKSSCPKNFKDFKSISLCNVIYKIISNVMLVGLLVSFFFIFRGINMVFF